MSRGEETITTTGFGEYLRREREMRGVSLQEISAATKISIQFLQAIESEQLSKLPGGIFRRSFVRSYARYLGLDEEHVLADCQLAGLQKPEVDIHRITASRPRPSRAVTRTRVIAVLVAGTLLTGGYALFRYSRRIMEQRSSAPIVTPSSATSPGTNAPTNAATAQLSTPAQSENNPPPTVTSAPPAAGAVTAPEAPQGGPAASPAKPNPPSPSSTSEVASAFAASTDLVLQLAATERTWLAVDADGKTVLQKVLNPDEVENLKAHESFDLTIGNAQGVVLTLNGETLKPLGRHGEVTSLHLTRNDLKKTAPER